MGSHALTVQLPSAGSLVVGRAADADLAVGTEGVSRKHAVIEIDRLRATVRDLGSRNGTFVNGERIGSSREVGHGDEIQLGDAHLTLFRPAGPRSSGGAIIHLHAAFIARLAIEMGRASGLQRALAVAVLRLPVRWYEMEALRAVLAALRPSDVCGAHADDALELALPDTDEAEASRVARTIVEALGASGIRAAVGVAAMVLDDTPEPFVQRAAAASLTPAPISTVRDAGAGLAAVVRDPEMHRIHDEARRIAPTPISVLIVGETGVGKEVLAHAVHAASGRRGRFVPVNVAALPETLLESELFGHERGAFTGAAKERAGLVEAAHEGTLFLDEIGELPLSTQAKLLRVLEEHTIRRIGATRERAIDVRFIAATNVELAQRAAEGSFRRDLLFRLNGCMFTIPPLRARPTEVGALAGHFLERAAGAASPQLSPAALDLLVRYEWPGNVRELKNAVERAVAMARGHALVEPEHFPETMRGGHAAAVAVTLPPPAGVVMPDVRGSLDALERHRILDALQRCGGNRTQAAKLLGLPRKTLAYRIERLGIEWH
jgi:DNA-binding NtrC family response regulator